MVKRWLAIPAGGDALRLIPVDPPSCGPDVFVKLADYDALAARLAEAERDIAQWKKVYDLRGRALQRPCTNCGYVPLVIHTDAIDAARASDSASVSPEEKP